MKRLGVLALAVLSVAGAAGGASAQVPIESELALITPVSKFIHDAALKAFADYAKERWGVAVRELRVDGGAAANDFLCQFQADLMDFAVLRPAVIETTSLGAAYLAGLGAGLWRSLDDLAGRWTLERRFVPGLDGAARQAQVETWRRAVERARGWASGQPE